MTIRLKLSGIISIIGMLLLYFNAVDAFRAFQKSHVSALSAEINLINDHFYDAAGALAVERGTVNGLLQSTARATATQQELISQSRAKSMAAMKAALSGITLLPVTFGVEISDTALGAFKAAIGEVETLRGKADSAMQGGVPDEELIKGWFGAMSGLIMKSDALAMNARKTHSGQSDTAISAAHDIKHALWEASEFAGRDRGVINGIIVAEKPMTLAQHQALGEFQGRIASAWATITAQSTILSPNFNSAIRQAEALYFTDFAKTRSQFLNANWNRAPSPVTSQAWFNQASEGINTMLSAQKLATEETAALIQDNLGTARRELGVALGFSALVLLATAFGIWIVLSQVTSPLTKITVMMTKLADQNLKVEVPFLNRRDEIGKMAQSVQVFKSGLIEAELLRGQSAARMVQEQLEEQRRSISTKLAEEFEAGVGAIVKSISATAADVKSVAYVFASLAEETSRQTACVTQSSMQASSNLNAIAGASEEITMSIQEIREQAESSRAAAAKSAADIARVADMILKVEQSSQTVAEVVGIIRTIAEQTNLLALNATIEAARAGAAGRGFSVVASEVKNLAMQAADATKSIAAQTQTMTAAAQAAGHESLMARSSVEEMNLSSAAIAASVAQQNAATTEITERMSHVAQNITEVSENISGVHRAAEETGAAATQAHVATENLNLQARLLETQVGEFHTRLKAA